MRCAARRGRGCARRWARRKTVRRPAQLALSIVPRSGALLPAHSRCLLPAAAIFFAELMEPSEPEPDPAPSPSERWRTEYGQKFHQHSTEDQARHTHFENPPQRRARAADARGCLWPQVNSNVGPFGPTILESHGANPASMFAPPSQPEQSPPVSETVEPSTSQPERSEPEAAVQPEQIPEQAAPEVRRLAPV